MSRGIVASSTSTFPFTISETHDPDEILDYFIDYSGILTSGETISTSVWSTSSNVTLGTNTNTTTVATAWVNSVIAETTTFKLSNTIVTSDSRTYNRSIIIKVAEK